jgi:hypothetical protein
MLLKEILTFDKKKKKTVNMIELGCVQFVFFFSPNCVFLKIRPKNFNFLVSISWVCAFFLK